MPMGHAGDILNKYFAGVLGNIFFPADPLEPADPIGSREVELQMAAKRGREIRENGRNMQDTSREMPQCPGHFVVENVEFSGR